MKEFGPHKPCIINLYPSSPPLANITAEDIELEGGINVSFLCKRSNETDFELGVTIKFASLFKGAIDITNLLTIHGHVTTITLQAGEVTYSIIGEVNLTILNYLITIISDILRVGINAVLAPGINLSDFFPFLKPLELSEIDIYLSEYYLAIEAFPKIDEKEVKKNLHSSLKSSNLKFPILQLEE